VSEVNHTGWWRMHWSRVPGIKQLAMPLLSQVSSFSVVERNSSTYNFIQSIKSNKLTSKTEQKKNICAS
jgi:hypothetical protein